MLGLVIVKLLAKESGLALVLESEQVSAHQWVQGSGLKLERKLVREMEEETGPKMAKNSVVGYL